MFCDISDPNRHNFKERSSDVPSNDCNGRYVYGVRFVGVAMKDIPTTRGDRKFVERETAIAQLFTVCGILIMLIIYSPVVLAPVFICYGAIMIIIGIWSYRDRWRTMRRIKNDLTDSSQVSG